MLRVVYDNIIILIVLFLSWSSLSSPSTSFFPSFFSSNFWCIVSLSWCHNQNAAIQPTINFIWSIRNWVRNFLKIYRTYYVYRPENRKPFEYRREKLQMIERQMQTSERLRKEKKRKEWDGLLVHSCETSVSLNSFFFLSISFPLKICCGCWYCTD